MQLKLSSPTIWIYPTAVDFRKSINGLSALVRSGFKERVQEGIFIFYSHDRKKIKLLAWHGNGFVLVYKRLEQGRFIIKPNTESYALDEKQLSWLLAGLDWVKMSEWNTLEYDDIY